MFWTSGDVSSTRANSQWTEQLLYCEYLAISISAHDFNIYLQKNALGNKVDKTQKHTWFNSYAHGVGFGTSFSPKCANHIY